MLIAMKDLKQLLEKPKQPKMTRRFAKSWINFAMIMPMLYINLMLEMEDLLG
jgi:hypothetical protein